MSSSDEQVVVATIEVSGQLAVTRIEPCWSIDMSDWPLWDIAHLLLALDADIDEEGKRTFELEPHDRAWCHRVLGYEGRG